MCECCLGKIMSDHGAATAFNRESFGIFCFLLFILTLCIPVHEMHKHLLVWEHVVSAQEAATDLNRKNPTFSLFILILYLPFH